MSAVSNEREVSEAGSLKKQAMLTNLLLIVLVMGMIGTSIPGLAIIVGCAALVAAVFCYL